MVLRALRPPMILGASLPGMFFPAWHPVSGSDSYWYGSHFWLPVDIPGECTLLVQEAP